VLGVTNPLTYVLGTLAVVLLPGPNSLYVLSIAARQGVRAGYRGAAGVWLGWRPG
jgi:leucine efflux protein